MRHIKPLIASLALLLFISCGKKESQAPEPLDASTFVAQLETEFEGSTDSVNTKLETAIKRFEAEEYIESEAALDEILYTEEISKSQQRLIGRALITLNSLIGEQARKGDKKAIQKLQRYQLTK